MKAIATIDTKYGPAVASEDGSWSCDDAALRNYLNARFNIIAFPGSPADGVTGAAQVRAAAEHFGVDPQWEEVAGSGAIVY